MPIFPDSPHSLPTSSFKQHQTIQQSVQQERKQINETENKYSGNIQKFTCVIHETRIGRDKKGTMKRQYLFIKSNYSKNEKVRRQC